jgi:hypothetical protein
VGSPEFADVLTRLATIRKMLVLGMIERSGDAFGRAASAQ